MIYKDNKINNITCRFENGELEKSTLIIGMIGYLEI